MICGDGVTDDYMAIQKLLDDTPAHGVARLKGGKVFKVCVGQGTPETGLVIPQGVRLDLNGSLMNFFLDGNVYGARLRDGAAVHNGRVSVAGSSNRDSLQGIYHAPITIGAAYGEVLDVNNLGPYIKARGWSIHDLVLSTVKPNGCHIAGMGGVSGSIRNIEVSDSLTAFGAINFDWGTIGQGGTIPQCKSGFIAGTFKTLHPNNIVIRDIRVGGLANPLSEAIRLSGCRSIDIQNVQVQYCGASGLSHYGGDFGFEYSGLVDRCGAYQNNTVRNMSVESCNANALRIDAWADNLAREPGYQPISPVISETNILIDGFYALSATGGTAVSVGALCGGAMQRMQLVGFRTGASFNTGVSRFKWRDSVLKASDLSSVLYSGVVAGVTLDNVAIDYH